MSAHSVSIRTLHATAQTEQATARTQTVGRGGFVRVRVGCTGQSLLNFRLTPSALLPPRL